MPANVRWVSHQFSDESVNLEFVRGELSKIAGEVVSSDQKSLGDDYLGRLLVSLSAYKTSVLDDWYTVSG